ncbi:MAG: 3-hydroxyacyl-ACP dehydratase FabZ [Propionibacteriaceae bacterium]|jgi:3-hydroxyacyl-[acyl-carrier-protein] dehydratase|nr:3-hydroxyacyl-ACP dehydratase FabZ [Propionibacteriaceae bacterium]
MNQAEIMDILPHRAPMLLVDEVELETDESGGRRAVGTYTVRGDEFFLQGHFPGNPVVPGVMLCEMMGQCSCVLIADQASGATPYFTSMEKVRFRHPVHPGDTIRFTSRLLRAKAPFYFVAGSGYVGDQLCVTAELSFALMRPDR